MIDDRTGHEMDERLETSVEDKYRNMFPCVTGSVICISGSNIICLTGAQHQLTRNIILRLMRKTEFLRNFHTQCCGRHF